MMTDNEIIKALDEISCNENLKQFSGIPHTAECALDLIKRQKAEIESLENKFKMCKEDYLIELNNQKYIKAEAIKEFAERLKAVVAVHNGDMWSKYEYIDNLVKEMVGEGK